MITLVLYPKIVTKIRTSVDRMKLNKSDVRESVREELSAINSLEPSSTLLGAGAAGVGVGGGCRRPRVKRSVPGH